MAVVSTKIGSIIKHRNNDYEIIGIPSINEVLLRDVNNKNKVQLLKLNELLDDYSPQIEKKLELVDIDDNTFDKALKKFEIIKPLLELDNCGYKEISVRAKECGVSYSSIYRWIGIYASTGEVSSLADNYQKCGGKGKERLSPEVNAIVNTAIKEMYLNIQRYSIKRIYIEIVNKCKNIGCKPPHINTIRDRTSRINPKKVAKLRDGKSVRETRGFPDKMKEPAMPYDLIEIDHTPVDAICVSEIDGKDIGRPFITVATDILIRLQYLVQRIYDFNNKFYIKDKKWQEAVGVQYINQSLNKQQ